MSHINRSITPNTPNPNPPNPSNLNPPNPNPNLNPNTNVKISYFEKCFNGNLMNFIKYFDIKRVNNYIFDKKTSTYLYIACTQNRPDIIKYLLSIKSIDVHKGHIDGITPFHISCGKYENIEICDLLYKFNNSVIDIPFEGIFPIYTICMKNKLESLKYFLSLPTFNVDQLNLQQLHDNEYTPIIVAIIKGNIAVLNILSNFKLLKVTKDLVKYSTNDCVTNWLNSKINGKNLKSIVDNCPICRSSEGIKTLIKIYINIVDQNIKCSICLENLNDKLCTTLCGHIFHVDCISDS